jgi:signal transduction histidine kinase
VVTNPLTAVRARPPAASIVSERQRLAFDVLAAVVALAAVALLVRMQSHPHEPRFVLPALACALIACRRRWPFPLLAIAAAAVAVEMAMGGTAPILSLLLGLGAYTVASRAPRRLSIPVALAAAAALGVALAFAAITATGAPLAVEAVEGFLPLAAAWFVGDSVAARRRYLAGLAEQAERERISEAERTRRQMSEERVRIARELHDVIAHGLTVITVQAGVGRRLMARRPDEAASALESIETIGRTAQEELRVVLGLLRDEEGRPAALAPAPGLSDLKELAETVRAAGTPVDLRASGVDGQLSQVLECSIYRVIQEALTNVVKHAPGARATVDLTVSAREVRIEVADDGPAQDARPPGPAMAPGLAGSGHGIAGMRERVGAFGGSLTAHPAAGRGFVVLAHIPLQDQP